MDSDLFQAQISQMYDHSKQIPLNFYWKNYE